MIYVDPFATYDLWKITPFKAVLMIYGWHNVHPGAENILECIGISFENNSRKFRKTPEVVSKSQLWVASGKRKSSKIRRFSGLKAKLALSIKQPGYVEPTFTVFESYIRIKECTISVSMASLLKSNNHFLNPQLAIISPLFPCLCWTNQTAFL